jgi:MFS transporter, PPP family, 3-phenylpropionic acid transporter
VKPALASIGPFLLLFAPMYAAFGASSPFLPALIEAKGVPPEQIGLIFGAATAIRLLSAPIAGRIADRTHALRATLAVCCVSTALAVLGYLWTTGFWPLLVVSLLHALALAPTTNLADALAVTASRRQGFEYGWVRGTGSAAFIAASIGAGFAISAFGLGVVVVLQAILMLAVSVALWLVPPVTKSSPTDAISRDGIIALARLPVFRRVVLVAAMILGSHALHDTFSVIRWTNAGISPQTASVLWSLAVAAEVIVFFLVGPWLLERLGPARAIAIAAVLGATRWLVSALTLDVAAIMLIQPLHGVTFALLHLACMRLLAVSVPPGLAATAQALYGTVGIGATSAFLTVISGWLYGAIGGYAFLIMSALCLAALPVASSLRGASKTTG